MFYRRMVQRGREKKKEKKNTKDFKAWIPVFTGMTEKREFGEKYIFMKSYFEGRDFGEKTWDK